MSDENWQKVREIFDLALRQKPEDRQEYLIKICGDNKELLAEVESLFDSLKNAEDFMETPAFIKVEDTEQFTEKLQSGDLLGTYEIIKLIGSGGMGEVYLARDKKLEREVAVKILNQKFSQNETSLRRFFREAKSASALNHPNILVIHEIGETDGLHYIVSEYVKGKTLREVLQENSLTLNKSLDIITQTANALAAAHEAKIVHRDIKPENIMVRPDGFIKVLDFGLAKLVKQNQSFFNQENSTVTTKGVILGTVQYMSPEQAKGEKIDERTDIFSLGVILYEMLAGKTPFVGDSMAETFANLINKENPSFHNFSDQIPYELQQIVSKILQKNLDWRYQTMQDLLTDVKNLRDTVMVNPKFEHLVSSELEKPTAIIKTKTDEANFKTLENRNFWQKIRQPKLLTVLVSAILLISIISFGYWFYGNRTAEKTTNANSQSKPVAKLYWQMTETEQFVFIQERARYIQTLVGDEPAQLLESELRLIKFEIDDYVEEKDSLSQKPFEEGLRVIYGRASQYIPIVIKAYQTRKVAPALGIYAAMIDSEYHDCTNYGSDQKKKFGLFQFSPKTAEKYGLLPKDYCNMEKQADAAAHYMSDLASDFGAEKSIGTLQLFSFAIGESKVRDYLRQLHKQGIEERSFWIIIRSENKLQPTLNQNEISYIPRFFAAAIIGETPESFELSTPPLTGLHSLNK